MAPIPQLGLSMSITDNAGSSFYTGQGQREKMTEFDSAHKDHTISIIISDEVVSEVELSLENNNKSFLFKLPTYKMMVTDDKTTKLLFMKLPVTVYYWKKCFQKPLAVSHSLDLIFLKRKLWHCQVLLMNL